MAKRSLKEYLSWEYAVVVVPEVRCDGTPCYEAYYPDLLGCRAQGNTPDEAKALLAEAKRHYLEIVMDQGDEPPRPATRLTATWKIFAEPVAMASTIQEFIREPAATRSRPT